MRKITSLILFTLTCISSVNAAQYPCNFQDKTGLEPVIKRYIDLHSTVSSREVTLQFIACQLNYAKIMIIPNKPITDPAISYLHKVNNKWEVIAFGTNFDEQILKQIPTELRKID